MKRGKLNIVFGGQAGSEAKGKLSGFLADKHLINLLVMTASPNAGHTIITPTGKKLVSYHLPIAAVMCKCRIVLTAASLINFRILKEEIEALEIDPHRILIDPRASMIHDQHIELEITGGKSNIGSTLQGIGACRTSKMDRAGRGDHTLAYHVADMFNSIACQISDIPTAELINNCLDKQEMVLCESTQGFDLDLEHGIDPVYCTSKMINPSMVAAEAGVAPSMVGDTYAVIRPYPIRVNNRTGTSGPYAEAAEIEWSDVEARCLFPSSETNHLQEITTTTKLPRRVFEFSWQRFNHMITVCRPTSICLQFANYLNWSCYETLNLPGSVARFIERLEASSNTPVEFVGTGPGHEDMIWRQNARELMVERGNR